MTSSGIVLLVVIALFVAYVVVRTLFITTMETPEPRYVLECFPALIALAGAGLWARDSDAEAVPRPPS